MLKKIVCIILAIACMIPFASCKKEEFYPEIPSTEEESRVVFSFKLDDEVYEVKYELYRTLFLTYKKDVDGGDNSVWTSEDKNSYVNRIDAKIIDAAANIFTVLHLAKKAGYDPFSKEVDTTIREYVKHSVDGYENAASYEDAENKKLGSKFGEVLMNSEKSLDENVYGKVVGNFIWYFVFDMAFIYCGVFDFFLKHFIKFIIREVFNIYHFTFPA